MRILNHTVVKILKRYRIATDEQLQPLLDEVERSGRSLQDVVLDAKLVSETELTKLFADYADIPYVEIDPRDIPSEVLNRIPERIARQYNAVIFQVDEDGLVHLAMDDPDDVQATNFIEKQVGGNIRIYIASHDNILQCLENYRGDVNQELNEVIDVQREDDGSDQQVSEADVAEDSPIAQTVNLLLEYAIRSQASDIHIEPRENFVQVRYRIDGVLKEVNQLPRNVLGALVSRIKILSNLKIDERRVPQDGRFKIKVAGKQYALRVSTLPIADGEKVVMRVLDESNQAISLEQLGYWGRSLAIINNAIAEPNGMILVTGPTGSGKSTSLFSVLNMLNTKYIILPLQENQTAPLQNPYTYGNAWFVDRISYVNNANQELDSLGKLNLRHAAVADVKFKSQLGEAVRQDNVSMVKITSYAPNQLSYDVMSDKGGVLVFSEIYYPGWTATVDGQPAELGRVNYVLRAMNIKPGKHQVTLRFFPASIKKTETVAYVSYAILILVILIGIFADRKKKQKEA